MPTVTGNCDFSTELIKYLIPITSQAEAMTGKIVMQRPLHAMI
jgi:hypothetical protein